MIAITFALPAESSDFVSLLEKPATNSREGVETIRGRLHGKSLAVIHTGVGQKNLLSADGDPAAPRGVSNVVISGGFAGALEKELRIGNLLVSENYSSPQLLTFGPAVLTDEGTSMESC